MSSKYTPSFQNWAPPKYQKRVSDFIDKALPFTSERSLRQRTTKINGEAFDPDEIVYDTSESTNNQGIEPGQILTDKDVKKLHTVPLMGAPLKDFANGVRVVWIVNLILAILHFAGFLTLLIYRSVIVSEGTTKIITVFLVTVFSIFNSDPVNHANQFFPTIWLQNSYLIDIPLIIMFFVAFAFCTLRVVSLMLIPKENIKYGSRILIKEIGKKGHTVKSGRKEVKHTFETVEQGGSVKEFNATVYKDNSLRNFYAISLFRGVFWVRWIEWAIDGSCLLWVILTLAPIQEIFLLVTLLMVYVATIACGFAHEWMNRSDPSNIDMENPLEEDPQTNETFVVKNSNQWSGFALGLFLNIWIWLVIFIYYGYADNFNPGAYQWFRLAVAPIGVAFYLLIIPIIILLWTVVKPMYYAEIDMITPERELHYLNPTQGTINDKNRDPEIVDYFNIKSSADKSYHSLKPHLKQKIDNFISYQDWNKNVIYEVSMLLAAAICKQSIAWIIWGGMLSS